MKRMVIPILCFLLIFTLSFGVNAYVPSIDKIDSYNSICSLKTNNEVNCLIENHDNYIIITPLYLEDNLSFSFHVDIDNYSEFFEKYYSGNMRPRLQVCTYDEGIDYCPFLTVKYELTGVEFSKNVLCNNEWNVLPLKNSDNDNIGLQKQNNGIDFKMEITDATDLDKENFRVYLTAPDYDMVLGFNDNVFVCRGNINNDNFDVDIKDLLAMRKILAKVPGIEDNFSSRYYINAYYKIVDLINESLIIDICDVNCDEEFNMKDISFMRNYLAGCDDYIIERVLVTQKAGPTKTYEEAYAYAQYLIEN
ncbi:MAG: hypothetical protein ACI39F_07255 [Acutalibacteraceae bacterium]